MRRVYLSGLGLLLCVLLVFSSSLQNIRADFNPSEDVFVHMFLLTEDPQLNETITLGFILKNRTNETIYDVTFEGNITADNLAFVSAPFGELTGNTTVLNFTTPLVHTAINGEQFNITEGFMNKTYFRVTFEAVTNTTTLEFQLTLIALAAGTYSLDEFGLRFKDYWGDSYPSDTEWRYINPISINIPEVTTDPRVKYLPQYNGTISTVQGYSLETLTLIGAILFPLVVIALSYLVWVIPPKYKGIF